MSVWYDIKDENRLSMSEDGLEVHINFKEDYNGACYVSIPTDMLKKFLIKD